MIHGILQSSFRFILNGPEPEISKSLAYQLADTEEYDVWLLNNRGNYFSREHSFLDADSSLEFWDFSFEEFGEKDIPAAIEFILSKSNYTQIALICYSQGTTAALFGISTESKTA